MSGLVREPMPVEDDDRLGMAEAHIGLLGWPEAAAENGGGWATAMIQRTKAGGDLQIVKAWLPGDVDGFWLALTPFLRKVLGRGRGAARVQVSRALWGREPEGLGRWAVHQPLTPKAGGLLRADLDVAEGHKAPDGQRLPTMRQALTIVKRWHEAYGWGQPLHVWSSGGGLTVTTRHPEAEALTKRWTASWKALTDAGALYLDSGACGGHGGLRLAGSQREGVRIDGEEVTLISGPRPVQVVDRGPMTVHEVWTLAPVGGQHLEHRLPEIIEPEREAYDPDFDEARGDRPGDKMATAVQAAVLVEHVFGWQREGDRLRQPGSTGADTKVLEQSVYPHTASDAMALGIELGNSATSFNLLAALLDDDYRVAARVAAHFDGKWGELLGWVSENEGDLTTAAGKLARKRPPTYAALIKQLNSVTTVADLGGDPAEHDSPAAYILWLHDGDVRRTRAYIQGLLK